MCIYVCVCVYVLVFGVFWMCAFVFVCLYVGMCYICYYFLQVLPVSLLLFFS